MATTVTTYYVSQDVSRQGARVLVLDTWSVYAEEWEPEALAAGNPIDGSQRLVSTHESEDAAQAEASRLFREADGAHKGSHGGCTRKQ